MINSQRAAVVFGGLAILASIAHSWHRYGKARSVAEAWLEREKYKVRSLKLGLFPFLIFSPRLFRSEERSFAFRAVVEDRMLGGTGVVWLRVWVERMGLILHDPDVRWEKRPLKTHANDLPPEEQWEMAQRGLLKRVARGETSFAAPRYPRDGEMPFDELVAHLLAMQKRGLVACSIPRPATTPGAHYEQLEFVELTDEGRGYLDTIA